MFRKGSYNVEISVVKLTLYGIEKVSTYNIKKILSEYLMKWHENGSDEKRGSLQRKNSYTQKLKEMTNGNEHVLFWKKYLG